MTQAIAFISDHPMYRVHNSSATKRQTNKNTGRKTETYAFKNPSDVQAMQEDLLYRSSTQRHYCLRNYLFFSLGVNMGFRASDLCNLCWSNIFIPGSSDFNFRDDNWVKEKKTGKKRLVVLNAAAQKAITFYVQAMGLTPTALSSDSYVFSSRKGSSHINPDSMRQIIKDSAARCDISFNVGTHSMRKTFGYNLYKASGQNIGLVQDMLNHASAKDTLRYIGIDKEQTRKAYDLLQDNVWTPGI